MTGLRAWLVAFALVVGTGSAWVAGVRAARAETVEAGAPTAPAASPRQTAQPPAASAASPAPTREAVQKAAQAVRADPNLPGTRTARTLRWKEHAGKPETSPPESRHERTGNDAFSSWIASMGDLIMSGARALVWLLVAALVIWALLRARRWIARRGDPVARKPQASLPSHVGTLDIRPESLPEDIGAAVAAIWQRGEPRAALSLLYRSALSRLVHGPAAVPIRAASTEGECLALAQDRLPPAAYAFFASLVEVWQRAAYAGRLPESAQVLALCAQFASHLPTAATATMTAPAPAARGPKDAA